jgi:hypothetical protein
MDIKEYRALWEHLAHIDLCYNDTVGKFSLEEFSLRVVEAGVEDLEETVEGDVADDEHKVYDFDKVPYAIIHDLQCLVVDLSDYLNEARGILFSLAKMAEAREGSIK